MKLRFESMNRGWKGTLVIARDENNDYNVDGVFLCVAWYGRENSASDLAYKLNQGEISVSKVLDKNLQRDRQWLKKMAEGKGRLGSFRPNLSREQMVAFEASEAQLEQWETQENQFRQQAKASFEAYEAKQKKGA